MMEGTQMDVQIDSVSIATGEVQARGPFSRFKLVRTVDVTGISGTGEIAIGVKWPDQSCTLFWMKHGTQGYYKTIGQLREIHCYSDNAKVEWID